MDKALHQRIIDRHSDSLLRYGYHPNALYWSNRDIQELRFKVLTEIGVQSGDAILDVGCGFSDLYGWLKREGFDVHYTGLDISPDLIAVAQEKNPGVNVFVGELTGFVAAASSFDWILLSGALNEPYADQGVYTRKVIRKMYRLAKKGVAFNLLNAKVVKAHDLQSFDANEMLAFCLSLSPLCQLRDDYLDNDFTIYMKKGV